jgi:membrane associated rhomboid family serine protease
MAWHDREYNQPEYEGGRRLRAPPRAAAILIGIHVVAFVLVQGLRADEGPGAAAIVPLNAGQRNPIAIVLHPFGYTESFGRDVLSLAFVVFVLWTLGAMVERRLGAGCMLAMYVAGSLAGGAVYYALARAAPHLAGAPLVIPAGGMSAWVLMAWLRFHDEVLVLGKVMAAGKLIAILAAISAGLRVLQFGSGATAWLAAVLAGGAALYVAERLPTIEFTRVRTPRARSGAREETSVGTPDASDREEVDRILAKISREGLDALTPKEHERLERARRELQRH